MSNLTEFLVFSLIYVIFNVKLITTKKESTKTLSD